MEAHEIPLWAQAAGGIGIIAASILSSIWALVRKRDEGHKTESEFGEEDIAEGLKHLRWIARHLERLADAAEERNRRAGRGGDDPPTPANRTRRRG